MSATRSRSHGLPDLPGVLSAAELHLTAAHLAGLQRRSGMIPWHHGGHCDPWNHVESAMALDVAGRHDEARAAYRWLADTQLPSGAWSNYYWSNGDVEEAKLDTNVCAYVATGAWHHWLSTGSRDDAAAMWPTVERALTWVLSLRRSDGLVLWAIEADGSRPWDYALLTGSSSIAHALRCGARLAALLGHRRRSWVEAANVMVDHIVNRPEAFEPKLRWAMDWYYPALTGALGVSAGKARLVDGWSTFVMEDLGVRCVSDEPWITASETAECAIAFAAIGDPATATDLLRWTRGHRRDDGSYWTGIVYPDEVRFPFEEHTSYTAAAIILAADAITGATPAARIFNAVEA
jgi:hypothetical protein